MPMYLDTNGLKHLIDGLNEGIPYETTAPVAANTSGRLKVVVLSAEPSQRFSGFLYIITSAPAQ